MADQFKTNKWRLSLQPIHEFKEGGGGFLSVLFFLAKFFENEESHSLEHGSSSGGELARWKYSMAEKKSGKD